MTTYIGPGGNQIGPELLQAVKAGLKGDQRISGEKEIGALREAALKDGVITETEAQFLEALGDGSESSQLVKDLQQARFEPRDLSFPSSGSGGAIAKAVTIGGTVRLRSSLSSDYGRIYGIAAGAQADLDKVKNHYQTLFQQNPGLVAKLKAHPAGEKIHEILSQKLLFGHVMKEVEQLLQQSGYDLGSAGVDGNFDLRTHAALEAFLKAVDSSPAAAAPVPARTAPGKLKELPDDKQAKAREGVTGLVAMGLSEADATELVLGMAAIDTARFGSQLDLLLKPEVKADVAAQLKDAVALVRSGRVKNVSLRDIGQVLITQNELASLRHDPGHSHKEFDTDIKSYDLGTTLKARLMTYLTLADAGGEYAQIAALIKDGRIRVRAENSEAVASYYGDSSVTSLGDSFDIGYQGKEFQATSLAQLFAPGNHASYMRATVIHEGTHAVDDLGLQTGIRLPGLTGPLASYDPDPTPAAHSQVSLEKEFSANYAEAYYLAQDLIGKGIYSKAGVLAGLQKGHPDFFKGQQALVEFIDRHVVNQQPVSEAEVKQLYTTVSDYLVEKDKYTRKVKINDGIMSKQRY